MIVMVTNEKIMIVKTSIIIILLPDESVDPLDGVKRMLLCQPFDAGGQPFPL